MEPLKHIGLFEGVGGFSLAARWMGWQTVAWCEWDSFCQRVLKYHFPNAEQHGDITKTDFTRYAGQIDILTGGFPCQGFSTAGLRLGTDDVRYYWPEMRRAYKEAKPRWIIGENVAGILSMEDRSGVHREVFAKVEGRKIIRYDTIDYYEAIYTRQAKMLVASICEDLEEDGYEVQPFVIPAASVGAPHRRDRVWFVAHSRGNGHKLWGFEQDRQATGTGEINKEKRERVWDVDWGACEQGATSNATGCGWVQECRQSESRFPTQDIPDWRGFPTESPICGRNDGIPSGLAGITVSSHRRNSIKAYGNAIVPLVALQIFKTIQQIEPLNAH